MPMPSVETCRLAWEGRKANHEHDPDPPDNAQLGAGSPMYFRCPSCYVTIVLPEDYLTRPRLCYDCLELVARDLIVEMKPSGTGWNWRGR